MEKIEDIRKSKYIFIKILDLLVNGPPHLLKEFLIHVQIILKIWNSSIHLTWNDKKKVVKFGGWKNNFW